MVSREDMIKTLIERYQDLAIKIGDASEDSLNYRETNKLGNKLNKLFISFREDAVLAEEILVPCLHSQDNRIRFRAASHCLALKKHVDESLKVLKEISDHKERQILSLDAKMTIKVWERQGHL